MGMLSEFKDFAIKGNMVDMAVGIIIGAAFGKIVASLVNDVIMPFIGQLMGGVDFSNLMINLTDSAVTNLAAAEEAGHALVKYGAFIQTIIDFLIIAFVIFIAVKIMNNMKKKAEEEPTPPSEEVTLLTEIRDSLKK